MRDTNNFILFIGILAMLFTGRLQNATAEDIEGSSDHPKISRYEGSEIIYYTVVEFDEYELLLSEAKYDPYPQTTSETKESLEGKVIRISYANPEERSSLEVFRNYEIELEKAGFAILYTCKNKECGGRAMSNAMVPNKMYPTFGDLYPDQRYLTAKLAHDDGDIYLGLYVAYKPTGGKTANKAYTQLDIVEIAPMQESMVKVDADAMAEQIFDTGSISIYGIYFDFDKADIKPESEPTIKEIASLLENNPELKIYIVGHTDNKGSVDYNLDLSQNRAEAVVTELTDSHGIDPGRVSAKGVGLYAPVASNKTEEGRAKNRRVELVEQ